MKKISKNLLALVIFLLIPSAVILAQDTWWEHTTLRQGRTFEMTARGLCSDNQGHLHLAYGESDLFYGEFDGSTWNIECADNESIPGYGASIQVDSKGVPWICYVDQITETLKLARKQLSGWTITTIDDSIQTQITPTILLDPQDNPHISYIKSGDADQVIYGTKTGADWQFQNLGEPKWESPFPRHCRLVLNDPNEPYIQCGSSGFYFLDNQWHDYLYAGNALAIGKNRCLHRFTITNNVIYNHKNPVYIASSTFIDYGASESDIEKDATLILMDNNEIHAFYLLSESQVKHAWKSGISWKTEVMHTIPRGNCSAIATVNINGIFHSVVYDDINGTMVHIYNEAGQWHSLVIDQEAQVMRYRCFDIDENGFSHIVFSDSTDDTVYYMTDTDGAWSTEALAVIPNVSDIPLSLNVDGNVIIGLHDSESQELCIYRKTENDFLRINLPGDFQDVLMINVIETDPGIYYCVYETDKQLFFVHNTFGTWTTIPIEAISSNKKTNAVNLVRSKQNRVFLGFNVSSSYWSRYIYELTSADPIKLHHIGGNTPDAHIQSPACLAVDQWGYLQDFRVNYIEYSKGYIGYLFECSHYFYDPIGPESWQSYSGLKGNVSFDIDSKGNGVAYLNNGIFVYLEGNNTFSNPDLNPLISYELPHYGHPQPATMKLDSRDTPVVCHSCWGDMMLSRKHSATVDLQLVMPHVYYDPGREFYLDLNIRNSGDSLTDISLWCILEIADQLYYYPDWSSSPEFTTIDIPAGETTLPLVEPFNWPDTGEDIIGRNHFYAALMIPDNSEFLDISSGIETWIFNYGPSLE